MTVLSGNIATEVLTVEVAEAMVDNIRMLSGQIDVSFDTFMNFFSNSIETFLLLLPHLLLLLLLRSLLYVLGCVNALVIFRLII